MEEKECKWNFHTKLTKENSDKHTFSPMNLRTNTPTDKQTFSPMNLHTNALSDE